MNLIIGNGLIGRHLWYRMREDAVLWGRKEIDLSRNGWKIPECSTVYICAGVTSTRQCEEDKEGSYLVNVTNTIRLAEKIKGHVVFLSSERVFDGGKPYRQATDKVCPTTEYGRQKAEAEKALLSMGATVIRLSKVLGWNVPLFEGWIEDLNNGLPIYPFKNMSMSPIPVTFACEFIEKVGNLEGLHQLSSLEDISYDRIAYHICNYMEKDMNLVRPIEAKEGHSNTTLDSPLLKTLGLNVPDSWETIYKWCKQRCRR